MLSSQFIPIIHLHLKSSLTRHGLLVPLPPSLPSPHLRPTSSSTTQSFRLGLRSPTPIRSLPAPHPTGHSIRLRPSTGLLYAARHPTCPLMPTRANLTAPSELLLDQSQRLISPPQPFHPTPHLQPIVQSARLLPHLVTILSRSSPPILSLAGPRRRCSSAKHY